MPLMQMAAADYPAQLTVEPMTAERNRLTTGFRIILAIPHLFLVGGGLNGLGFSLRPGGSSGSQFLLSIFTAGILSSIAGICAVISWFAIMFTGTHPKGLWDFELWVLRWQTRVTSYVYLFRDEYPPFGEAEYPAAMNVEYPATPRDRLSVGLRIFYVIPHALILAALGLAWTATTAIAWFAILFTGVYPPGLYDFGLKVFRWSTRVSAYIYLLRVEYPPFAFE